MHTLAAAVTREIYWNIDIPFRGLVIVILGLVPFAIIAYGLWQRWQRWQRMGDGVELPPRDEWWSRTKRTLVQVFAQKRIRRRKQGGYSHVMIFWSFVLLFIGTVIVAIQTDLATPLFDWYFFDGAFYVAYSIVLDLAGLGGIAACCFALYRRYVTKPETLTKRMLTWTPHIWVFLVLLVQGFILEACRISGTGFPDHEVYASPVGNVFAQVIPTGGIAEGLHLFFWWFHLALTLVWLGMFGQTAMAHIFTSMATIWLAREIPVSTPRPIVDIEEAEEFGVLTVDQFINTHLRDADACVECGRCTDVCPANITGKPLSPKKIINDIKEAWLAYDAAGGAENTSDEDPTKRLVGGIISQDELWSCTTCGACEQECPVMIEQVDKIVQMRRGLVLMESEFPEEVQNAFNNMEQQGNPWGKPPDDRSKWIEEIAEEEDLIVPIWGEEGSEDAEYLFWVGCAGALDARSLPITKSVALLIQKAGVKFAVLGPMESCTGDPALRIGNEYLYQILAQQNIEVIKEAGVKKIVTQCPHCFQSFNKDYRKLDGSLDYEVIHHTQLISELLEDKRLEGIPGIDAKAILHDSCYLARHNKVTDEPRNVAKAALGNVAASEPKRCGEKTFCCGAGGGRMWMEEHLGDKNVNAERAEELLKDGADTILTSCPFCKTMLSDGAKVVAGESRDVKVMDVAEALAQGLKKTKTGNNA